LSFEISELDTPAEAKWVFSTFTAEGTEVNSALTQTIDINLILYRSPEDGFSRSWIFVESIDFKVSIWKTVS
jgi:hypothetical protein